MKHLARHVSPHLKLGLAVLLAVLAEVLLDALTCPYACARKHGAPSAIQMWWWNKVQGLGVYVRAQVSSK